MPENQDQIEYWNGPVGERWVKYQKEFDRAIGVFGDAALARLPLAPGARVLDVGCGAGASTLGILARVAPGGSVVGVDVSGPLVALARERVSPRAAELGVRFDLVLADASTYVADEPFDALFSRFGLMFFERPVPAFTQLRAALRSGARASFVCWRALAENSWCAVPFAAARRVVEAPAAAEDPRAPGPFAFADREYVEDILVRAGFDDVAIEPFDAPVVLSASGLRDAVDMSLRLGPTGRLVAEQPEDVIARVREEITKELTPLVEGDGVRLMGAAWLVTARAR